MIEIRGKGGIVARIILDSISKAGVRLVTMELEYPRVIHSEFMTHRMFSRNAASSRAIPFTKMLNQLGAAPVRFGQANPGMQDKGVDYEHPISWDAISQFGPRVAWDKARYSAQSIAQAFYEAGYHKQVYNRLLEPFQFIKVVVSATEWSNFFWLRDDGPADPTIAELAQCVKQAYDASKPFELLPGEWHLPYIKRFRSEDGSLCFHIDGEIDPIILSIEDAIKVSGARSAAVSYRNEDYGVVKSQEVYDRLVGDDHKHGSALEHQAKLMSPVKLGHFYGDPDINIPMDPSTWEAGVSHMDKKGQLWSGNFKGWIQNRKLIPGENKED